MANEIKKILVIQLRQLGDILLTTPVLRQLKQFYPNAELHVLTHSMGRLIFNHNPFVSKHWTYSEADSLVQQFKLLHELKSQAFDFSFDFMANPRSAFYSWIIGGGQRCAFKTRRALLYTRVYCPPLSDQNLYICRVKMNLVAFFARTQQLDTSKEVALPELYWPFHHDQWAMTWMIRVNAYGDGARKPRVVISPTHRRSIRKWSPQQYAELSRMLSQTLSAHITWLWGPGEESDIDVIMQEHGGVGHKAPASTFAQMAALIKTHDLFIGNSNGPSHVAVAAGVASIQLHGHTFAKSWCPSNEDSPHVEHCAIQSPLFKSGLGKVDIIGAITVESVFQQAKIQLERCKRGSND